MTNDEIGKHLISISSDTKVTAERVKAQGETLSSLAKDVWGNGEPGIEKDVTLLKERQENCPARKANSIENKRLAIASVAMVVAILSAVTTVAFGLINVMK